jgi:hypothetical protein
MRVLLSFLDGTYNFWGQRKIFWFECKTRIIHIRICENVFLTINTRWCIMKVHALNKKTWVMYVTKMFTSKTTPTLNGEHVIIW